VRTVRGESAGATTVVLVRHGEAVCGVSGVVGGISGCTGLTPTGKDQVRALAERLTRTGELGGVAALYASVLPRAVATAELLAPALDRWRDGPPLEVITDCGLCELHPGEADGLTWAEFLARYEEPDWDADPARPLAPGGESWRTFVERASAAVARVADQHPGERVVVACHAGVIESTVLRFLPIADPSLRLGLRTENASLTIWERSEVGWLLRRYNDVAQPG
jgi:probable phosphoglycerate mutase